MKLEGLCRSLKKANEILDNIDVYVDLSLFKNLFSSYIMLSLKKLSGYSASPKCKILQGRHSLTENQLEKS